MVAIILLYAMALITSVLSVNNTDYEEDPIGLTISPKIWELLESKAAFINAAATTLAFDGFNGKENLVKYTVSGGHIEQFSIPKWGVTFYDMNNGIHLGMKNIFFRTTVHVRAEIGKKVFKKWIRIARISGDVKLKAECASLEATLVWKNFAFVPTGVRLNSDLRIDFTHHLRRVNFLRSKIQKQVTKAVDKLVPNMITNLVYNELNPRLLSLKQRPIATDILNLSNFDDQWAIQWTVQNNFLRTSLKPKNLLHKVVLTAALRDKILYSPESFVKTTEIALEMAGCVELINGESEVTVPVKPISKMLCVSGNLRKILEFTLFKQRSKRAVPNFDLSCVAPHFECREASCSFCTDVDINPASVGAGNTLLQCLLKL